MPATSSDSTLWPSSPAGVCASETPGQGRRETGDGECVCSGHRCSRIARNPLSTRAWRGLWGQVESVAWLRLSSCGWRWHRGVRLDWHTPGVTAPPGTLRRRHTDAVRMCRTPARGPSLGVRPSALPCQCSIHVMLHCFFCCCSFVYKTPTMKIVNHSFKSNQSPPRHICKEKLGSYVLLISLLRIAQTSFWDDGDLLIL